MKVLRVGFSKPKSIWKPYAWLIRWFEGTPYSHVYMKHHSDKYSAWLIYQASGTQVNFMSEKHFDHVAVTVSEFEFEVTDEEFDSYMRFAISEAGAPYSIRKIWEIITQKDIWNTSEPEWVCSVLAGFAIKNKVSKEFNWQLAGPKMIYLACEKYGKRV